jgi:putative oxidoreductase
MSISISKKPGCGNEPGVRIIAKICISDGGCAERLLMQLLARLIFGTLRPAPSLSPSDTSASWMFDVLIALPRIVCGIILPVKFGLSKFPPPQWFIDDVGKLGFPLPVFFAWAAVLSEVVASFLLAAGFMTRLMALLVMITMFVAAFVQKGDAALWEKLPSLFFLLNAYFALLLGSGRLGVDEVLRRTVFKPVPHATTR